MKLHIYNTHSLHNIWVVWEQRGVKYCILERVELNFGGIHKMKEQLLKYILFLCIMYNSQPMPLPFTEPQYPFMRLNSLRPNVTTFFHLAAFFRVGCFFFLVRGYNFWRIMSFLKCKTPKDKYVPVPVHLVRSFRYCTPWFEYSFAFVGASERDEIVHRTPAIK